MTIHFEWKVLFRTIEAQLVHNLGALWSAEMLQEVTLRRAHPLFGTHCPVQLPVQHCCVTHGPGRSVPPFCTTTKSILHSIPCMQLVVKSVQVPKLLLDSKNSVYLSGGGGHGDCKLRGWCSNPGDQHKAFRILFLLQLQVTAKERVGDSHSVNRNVSLHLLVWTLQTRTNSCNVKLSWREKLIPICVSCCLQLFLMGGSGGSSVWSF